MGATVNSYEDDEVKLSNGEIIKTKNLIWVAGVKANSIEGFDKELYGRGNRIVVNEYNQVNGFKNVFTIGDTALVVTPNTPNGHPQVAQPAIQQGANVANNLNKFEADGSSFKPFKYVDKGSLATIGRNSAVAELPYAQFRGFLAWILWLFVHIMNICFVMKDEYKELEDEFGKFAIAKGMVGIKGHRSVGGFRASTYNALPKESVVALIDAMKEFEKLH